MKFDLTHIQRSMGHLRETEATWVPFIFTRAFGGKVHVLPRVPEIGDYGLHDLLLIEEATDEELLQLGRRTSAAVYLPRESALADGVLTKEDFKGFEALAIEMPPQAFSAGPTDEYFMHGLRPREAGASKKPAVFLDRDGTIIELVPYVKDPALVVLMDGIVEFLKRAVSQGYLLVCVTNQSGLGRGYYDLAEFQAVQHRMNELLAAANLKLDVSFFAGFHAESENLVWTGRPSLRKPRPGMLIEAARRLSIDMSQSIMVGDSLVDMQVAGMAGVKAAYQIQGPAIELSHYGCPGQRIESFDEIPL